MYQVAIIEDEAKAVENLRLALNRYGKETGETFQLHIFRDAELFLTNYKPKYDMVFMDIVLPGMNGLEAARKLRKFDEEVCLVFITSMAQFAIKGYEVNALDYFVKPFKYYDLKMRLDRMRKIIGKRAKTLFIPVTGGSKNVTADDIYYIEVKGHTLIYHTKGGVFTARGGPMKDLEEKLKTAGFSRCGVGYLVNLRYCKQIRGDEVLVNEDWLKISRAKKKEFVDAMSAFFKTGE